MAENSFFYGRNVLREALAQGLNVVRVYAETPGEAADTQQLLQEFNVRPKVERGSPGGIGERFRRQGVVFEVAGYDPYISELPQDLATQYPLILLCNHLEDVQNLGAIARSAAAFGVTLIAHESRRSVRLNAAAVSVSAGNAFRLRFYEQANLAPLLKKLEKAAFWRVGLGLTEAESQDLYSWEPQLPLALVLGAEHSGLSRSVEKQLDFCLRIPMREGVDSLNVSQAASIAMSWIHAKTSC